MTTPNVPHRFELELTVPGTPEQVWEAIATPEGISGWMMPTRLEPREGGTLTFDMGPDMSSEGKVTAYEPSHRFAYEEYWGTLAGHPDADVTPLATEFLVEARSGGTCVVRVVTSAYGTGADWENEFWAEMDQGWAPMLDNLRLYLTHFAGQQVTPLYASATFAGSPEDAVDRVRAALGVRSAGDRVDALGLDAVVERTIPRHFLLRVEQPPALLSIFSYGAEGGTAVNVGAYLYGPDGSATAERLQPQWQAWMNDLARDTADAPSA